MNSQMILHERALISQLNSQRKEQGRLEVGWLIWKNTSGENKKKKEEEEERGRSKLEELGICREAAGTTAFRQTKGGGGCSRASLLNPASQLDPHK